MDELINIENISITPCNNYIEFPKGINRILSDGVDELGKKLDIGVSHIKLIFINLKGKDIKLDAQLDKLTDIYYNLKLCINRIFHLILIYFHNSYNVLEKLL